MSEEEILSLNGYLDGLYQAMQIGDITFESKHSNELYNLIKKVLEENQKYKEAINEIKEVCNSIPTTHTICGIDKIHDIEIILKEVKND